MDATTTLFYIKGILEYKIKFGTDLTKEDALEIIKIIEESNEFQH